MAASFSWGEISAAGLVGGLIGSFVTHLFAAWRDKKKEFRDAGRRLREAFAPELATFDPISGDRSLLPSVINERLKTAFPRHRAAIVEFGFYLSNNKKEDFEKAWRAYYESGGSVNFDDYAIDDENGYQLFQDRVHAILAFI